MENQIIPDEHQDLLEENFEDDNNQNNQGGDGGNPNPPGDEIDNNPAEPAGPAAELGAPLPDEIDAINNMEQGAAGNSTPGRHHLLQRGSRG